MPYPVDETIDFQVIGERKDDPGHLLMLGDDGHWYDYDIALGSIVLVDPSELWAVDIAEQVTLRIEVPKDILVS